MDESAVIDVLRAGLWAAWAMCLPVLGVSLAVGLAIGLIQALTSIQEMTLTFVPKLAAIGVVLWMSSSLISQTIITYFQDVILPLVTRI
jgi:flagellar biosynthesis protein FliQ